MRERLGDQRLGRLELAALRVRLREQRHREHPPHVLLAGRRRLQVAAQQRLRLAAHAGEEDADGEEVRVDARLGRALRADGHRAAGERDGLADVRLGEPHHRPVPGHAGEDVAPHTVVLRAARRLLGEVEPGLGLLHPAHGARHAAAREHELGEREDGLAREPVDPAEQRRRLAAAVEVEPGAVERRGRRLRVTGRDRVLDRPVEVAAGGEPGARPAVQPGHLGRRLAQQLALQHLAEQVVEAEPAALGVERDHEQVAALELRQHVRRRPGARVTASQSVLAEPLEDRGADQEVAQSRAPGARRPPPTGSRRGSGRRRACARARRRARRGRAA